MKLKDLADRLEGRVSGDPETTITGVSGVKESERGDITYLADKKRVEDIFSTRASAVIVSENIRDALKHKEDFRVALVVVDNPQFAFAKALEIFYGRPFSPSGVSEKALIGSNVLFGDDVSIFPFAHVCDNVVLGERVTISTGAYIGEGASIGNDTYIHPNSTILKNVKIGEKVIIHSGTVIGSDGFGYVMDKGTHYKIPQVGGVIIEDNVEIGANVTIDRATVGNTIIGSGTKIDNLVQIAHNVKIGKNCIIVSQVGISGSVEIGDGVILAGQVGVRDHVKIGSRSMAGAQSGIGADIPEGQIFSGSPAIPHKTWLRAQNIYARLPEYIKRLQQIERKLQKEEQSDDEQQ